MLNAIWLGMMLVAVVFAVINGRVTEVVAAVTDYAKVAIDLSIGMAGIMVFWLGLMRIAEEAGFVENLAKWLRPIMRRLFPEVPTDHPAMGAMVMNIAANMLGLVNAATPFGLRAMEKLQTLNRKPKVASNAMVTFLAINTSSVQLIPTTAIAYLAAGGDPQPTRIITTALLATLCSTAAAIIAVKLFERHQREPVVVEGEPT